MLCCILYTDLIMYLYVFVLLFYLFMYCMSAENEFPFHDNKHVVLYIILYGGWGKQQR